MIKVSKYLFLLMAAVVTVLPTEINGQSAWSDWGHESSISLEYLRPNFVDSETRSISGQAVFLNFRSRISERAMFVAELPYAKGKEKVTHFLWDWPDYYEWTDQRSQDALGNLYLGVEAWAEKSPLAGEIGIRLPTASSWESGYPANEVGWLADFDRFEAFLPDWFSISGAIKSEIENKRGFIARIRLAPTLLLYAGEDEPDDKSEAYLHYTIQCGYRAERFSLAGGISGVTHITAEEYEEDKSEFQLGTIASYQFGRIKPGLTFRLPISDNLKEEIDAVYGLNVQFAFE